MPSGTEATPNAMQERDVYLFDDVLAAVDAPVAAWLLRHALTGPLLAGRTRVLVSHAAAAAAAADTVVRCPALSVPAR